MMGSVDDDGVSKTTVKEMKSAPKEDNKKPQLRNRSFKKYFGPPGGVSTSNDFAPIRSPVEFEGSNNGVLHANQNTTPQKTPNIAFNSFPPTYLSEQNGNSTEMKGQNSQILRSCPWPSSTTPILSREINADSKEKNIYFDPYWPDEAVDEALKKGIAFKAKFRVNAHNLSEAYCTVNDLAVDIMISGLTAQNRAIEGDTVAITLNPTAYWYRLRGPHLGYNHALDVINITPETKPFNNAPTNEPHEISCEEKLKNLITSNPTKRPTGRVVSILVKSSRRKCVVGILSTKSLYQPVNNNNKNDYHHDHNHGSNSIERKNHTSPPGLHLIPNDWRFPKMRINTTHLPKSIKDRIKNGDIINLEKELISAKIVEWKENAFFPEVHVIKILGNGVDLDVQMNAIIFEHAIQVVNFSEDSLSSLPGPLWKVPDEELKSRRDLRSILTFTIDPSTAVDLDDALSIEMVSEGIFRVGVHIADVAYFVKPSTELDDEAMSRSTSVYMVHDKFSMLPEELSQGCASLMPGFERLTLSVIWDIDLNGNILDRWIGKSVIFSSCKLSYDLVQQMINTGFDTETLSSSSEISIPPVHGGKFNWRYAVNSVRIFYELSKRLKENRFSKGALRLDNAKLSFLFDEEGAPCDTYTDNFKKEAYSLIEEFMLMANKSIAEVISNAYPDCALLRRHPEPNLRKLKEFEIFCAKHGFNVDTSSSGQLHFSLSKIRENLEDPTLFDILVFYACKPMQSASYFCTGDLKEKKDEWGHYALSVPFYTHFTSPIRRYADILVHRMLYAVLDAEGVLGKRFFTGMEFDHKVAESTEGKLALDMCKDKFGIPPRERICEIAEHCNERKFAAKHAEEDGRKLYFWALLKKKQIVVSEARVTGLGPKFVTVYVGKLATERRIYYDEIEGLAVEWMENTGTLVLDLRRKVPFHKIGKVSKFKPIEDFALIENPSEEEEEEEEETETERESDELVPVSFPLVLKQFSPVPVALHAIGGDDGPIGFGIRLYASSYFCQIENY